MNVVDEDPDLARDLSAERQERARRDAVARLVVVEPGSWVLGDQVPPGTGVLGLLVLEGVLARSVSVEGRQGLEVFGPGDIVRPEPGDGAELTVRAEVGWKALARTRLALLDASFTSRMCAYPEVIDRLGGRLERRSSTHALQLTINQQPKLATRLHLVLWHLADRFGRVQADGVVLPLPLSHELLAQLVGAQRPSVSKALKELAQANAVARLPDGFWRLGDQRPAGARG